MNQNQKLAIASGVVVLASIVVLAASALTNNPTVLDPASPSGVVQQYVAAVTDEDWVAARALFTPQLAEKCTVSDLSQSRMDNVSRVSIDDVSQTNDTAIVKVVITYSSTGDPLSTSTWDENVTFVLIDSAGWVFDEVSWPYFACERFDS